MADESNKAGSSNADPPLNSPTNAINIHNTSAPVPVETLLDHLELNVTFNCPALRTLLQKTKTVPVTRQLNDYLHNPKIRKTVGGQINVGNGYSKRSKPLKYACTNGKKIFYAYEGKPYSHLNLPQRNSTPSHNQLTDQDKIDITGKANGKPWHWQLEQFLPRIDTQIMRLLKQHQADGITQHPVTCPAIEFYREYPTTDLDGFLDKLSNAIGTLFGIPTIELREVSNRKIPYLIPGRSKYWEVTLTNKQRLSIKCYEKGDYLRLEFRFIDVVWHNRNGNTDFTPLFQLGTQSEKWFARIEKAFNAPNTCLIQNAEKLKAALNLYKTNAHGIDRYVELLKVVGINGIYEGGKINKALRLKANERQVLIDPKMGMFTRQWNSNLSVAVAPLIQTKSKCAILYLRKDWQQQAQCRLASNQKRWSKATKVKPLLYDCVHCGSNTMLDNAMESDSVLVSTKSGWRITKPMERYKLSEKRDRAS